MKYFYVSILFPLLLCAFSESHSEVFAQSANSYFNIIGSDHFAISWDVQDVTGNKNHSFHTYYGVLNESNINRRTYEQIRQFNIRAELYEILIDEILAQEELNPLYLIMDRVANLSVSTLEDKRHALAMLYPMFGVSGDLFPIVAQNLNLDFDVPVDASMSLLNLGVQRLQYSVPMKHLGEASGVLERMGYNVNALSELDHVNQLAVLFTLFMAMDIDLYRLRLEDLFHITTLEDQAFWSALHNISSRLDRIDSSYWRGIHQFGLDHADEILGIMAQDGLLTLNGLKSVLGTKYSTYLPLAGALMFTHSQFKMAKGHWESIAYGTLAGTLYKDIDGKSDELQSYLGYIYLRERNLAFRNWTTSLFTFLNFPGWAEVLGEFERTLNIYKQDWMDGLLSEFIRHNALPQITEERELELNICDQWSEFNSGGVGGTLDRWDISMLPDGALIDVRFDTNQIPDLIIMEYPIGMERLNTGWRGSMRYEGSQYPGGIVEPGVGEELGVFQKGAENSFIVKVFGVDRNTIWDYQVRCRETN